MCHLALEQVRCCGRFAPGGSWAWLQQLKSEHDVVSTSGNRDASEVMAKLTFSLRYYEGKDERESAIALIGPVQ